MIYLLTGVVRILFAFVEGIVKLVLYLLRVFGLIVPAIYLLVMFAINLATHNAVLENYYPLFVGGLCLSMAGAVLLFFRNTVKNPLKAVKVNRRAKELDRYEQELAAREQHLNELEQRCRYLEEQLARTEHANRPSQQTDERPRFDSAANNGFPPESQAIPPQTGASHPTEPMTSPYGTNANGGAPRSFSDGRQPYLSPEVPDEFLRSVPSSPAVGRQQLRPEYDSAPNANGYRAYGNTQNTSGYNGTQNTEGYRAYGNAQNADGYNGNRTADGSFEYGRTGFRSERATPYADNDFYADQAGNTQRRNARRGLFGRRERNASDRRTTNSPYEAPLHAAPNNSPIRENSPFAEPSVPSSTVSRPGERTNEAPEIFRVRQDPRYLVYDYSDRTELYLETEQGLEFIKTDYKK